VRQKNNKKEPKNGKSTQRSGGTGKKGTAKEEQKVGDGRKRKVSNRVIPLWSLTSHGGGAWGVRVSVTGEPTGLKEGALGDKAVVVSRTSGKVRDGRQRWEAKKKALRHFSQNRVGDRISKAKKGSKKPGEPGPRFLLKKKEFDLRTNWLENRGGGKEKEKEA